MKYLETRKKPILQKEKRIFETLEKDAKLADEIAVKMNLSIEKFLNLLSVLEINGVVEEKTRENIKLNFSR